MVKARQLRFFITVVLSANLCQGSIALCDAPNDFGPAVTASTTMPTTLPGRTPSDFTARIEEVLGITDTGAEVLVALEAAIKKMDASPGDSTAAINTLTDSLLKGPHPSVLLERFLPLLEIGAVDTYPTNKKEWKWGTMGDRNRLASTMGKLAAALESKDPKRASEIARASLMLSALSNFCYDWNSILVVTNSPKDKMGPLLAMHEEQFQKLVKLVQEKADAEKMMQGSRIGALYFVDKISESKDPVKVEDVKRVLQMLDDIFRKSSGLLGDQWEIISHTWVLLNLMTSKKSADGQAAARSQLEAWKKDFPDPNIQRWISQALTRNGAPVGKLILVQPSLPAKK